MTGKPHVKASYILCCNVRHVSDDVTPGAVFIVGHIDCRMWMAKFGQFCKAYKLIETVHP